MGRTVTVKPHKLLQDFWGKQATSFQGVNVTEDAACQPDTGCILSLCGTRAVFERPIITGYRPSLKDATNLHLISVLCIARGSNVTIKQGMFSSCHLTPLAVYDPDTNVELDRCMVEGITAADDGAGMFVQGATVRIRSSTFKDNVADADGGAIAIWDHAHVTIIGSQFYNNTANWGGALDIASQSRVEIMPLRNGGPGEPRCSEQQSCTVLT